MEQTKNPKKDREDRSLLLRALLLVLLAFVVGFIVGCYFCHKDVPPAPDPTPCPHCEDRVEKERTRLALPFFDEPVNHCDESEFGRGATLDAGYEEALGYAVRGLQWCSLQSGGVEIDVQGFASRRPFACNSEEKSNDLNLKLAEARRRNVVGKITAFLDTNASRYPGYAVRIVPSGDTRWTGATTTEKLQDMREHMAFKDHFEPGEDTTPEIFTRRVDIVITTKGRCTPEP